MGRPFSSLDIGVCSLGLSFSCLCKSVFLKYVRFLRCVKRWYHSREVRMNSPWRIKEGIYFIEDEYVSQIGVGSYFAYVIQLLRFICWIYP